MRRNQHLPKHKAQALGLGLVEIMISLVIGLLVLGVLSTLLIGGKHVNKTQDELANMQENARFALSVIGKAIRQTGYRLDVASPLSAPAIEAINGKGSGATAKPDSITLRRDPAWVADPRNEMKGEEANCAGSVITSDNALDAKSGIRPPNTQLLVTSFSIDQGELRCATVNSNGKATSAILASQIENMQLTYAQLAVNDGKVIAYETADRVTRFSQVAAVRVELLVKSASQNVTSTKPQTLHFNGSTRTYTDGFLRQVYVATFALRNRPE